MGLLDDILNSYGGGGLLGSIPTPAQFQSPEPSFADRFNAVPNAPQPFVPSGRSFDQTPFSTDAFATVGRPALPASPMFAQAPAAAWPTPQPAAAGAAPAAAPADSEDDPPASPINIGSYRMPRIGPASAYEPQEAASDVSARARTPMSTAMPAQPAPQEMGIGDRLGAGFRGAMANASSPLGLIFGGIAGLAGMGKGSPEQQQAKQMGFAANALLQKGVDPVTVQAAVSNPEIMKTLVTQHFGPQTVTPLGNGYVADKAGNIKRAYEPEDKIPSGFAKDASGNMNFIPGGPADPAYQRLVAAKAADPNAVFVLGKGGELYKKDAQGSVTIVHKNAEDIKEMDPDSLDVLARREIAGDFGGRKNLGRGAQGASDLKAITNRTTEILTKEMGMTPAQAAEHLTKKQQEYAAQGQGLNSEARTTGVREANLNLILKAADAAIPAALEASDKVSRTGWVPLNKIIQHGEVMTSNAELKQFGMANLQLAEHWARAMNPTGVMRESDRDKALSFLSTADSKETYKAAVGQLRTQIERERDAVKATRGMSDLPGSSTPAPGAGSPIKIDGYTIKEH